MTLFITVFFRWRIVPAARTVPRHPREKMETKLDSLIKNPHCRMITFQGIERFSKKDIQILWKLDTCNQKFKSCLNLITKSLNQMNSLSPEKAFVEKMLVGKDIVNGLAMDPQLPDQFLPGDWQAPLLRRQFNTWADQIHERSRSFWDPIF